MLLNVPSAQQKRQTLAVTAEREVEGKLNLACYFGVVPSHMRRGCPILASCHSLLKDGSKIIFLQSEMGQKISAKSRFSIGGSLKLKRRLVTG